MLGALSIFRQSMRHCRVRFPHVLRVWIYAAVLPMPRFIGIGLVGGNWLEPYASVPSLLVWLIVGLVVFSSYSLVCAYTAYLKMRHAAGVVLAAQTIAVLGTLVAAGVVWPGFFWSLGRLLF